MSTPPTAFELDALTLKSLKSQHEFIFHPAAYSALDGGWGSGKTRAMCVKALALSYAFPGNLGLIGRYNATDLQDSTMVEFFDVCPRSWIKTYNKSRKWLTFTNGSQIAFRHLSEPNPKHSHVAGMSLGWFAIDQAEECGIEHWNTLCGRLRRPAAVKRFGFLAANPNGKDWIYNLFFSEPPTRACGSFATVYEKGDLCGIAVRSDENRKSNGGFVDDSYFEGLRQNMPPEWVARFLDCSFEDFSGKIYKEYTLDSVHNVEPFDIPRHWASVVGIDVGGDPAPWGIPVGRIDDFGNIVWTHEYYRATVNMGDVVQWYKENVYNWKAPDTLNIIDPENKIAMLEFVDHDIHCRPAVKAVRPGIIRVGGYIHVNPSQPLPPWYTENQPFDRVRKYTGKGAPRMFFFRTLHCARKEFDNYQWDTDHPDKPLKKNDHICLAGWVPVQTTHGAVPIEELVGKEGHCYSYKNGEVVVRRFSNVVCTGTKELWRVHFDDSSYLDVTENHPFMLRNGEYREAARLLPGESLMPFRTDLSRNRWVRVRHPNGKWEEGHRIVARTVLGEVLQPELHVHHKDSEGWNNDPANLAVLTRSEHASAGGKVWGSGACLYCSRRITRTQRFHRHRPHLRIFCDGNCSRLYRSGYKPRKRRFNHRVVRVERMGRVAPVYNLAVEETSNFASAGIFLHNCDAVRYVVMARPHASELKPMDDARVELRKSDPGTAQMWDAYDKRMEARMNKKAGRHALTTELFGESEENSGAGEPVPEYTGFDWGEA